MSAVEEFFDSNCQYADTFSSWNPLPTVPAGSWIVSSVMIDAGTSRFFFFKSRQRCKEGIAGLRSKFEKEGYIEVRKGEGNNPI